MFHAAATHLVVALGSLPMAEPVVPGEVGKTFLENNSWIQTIGVILGVVVLGTALVKSLGKFGAGKTTDGLKILAAGILGAILFWRLSIIFDIVSLGGSLIERFVGGVSKTVGDVPTSGPSPIP